MTGRRTYLGMALALALAGTGCAGKDDEGDALPGDATAVEAPAAMDATDPSQAQAAPVPQAFGDAGTVEEAMTTDPVLDPTQVPPESPEEPPQGSMVPEPPPAY